MNLKGISQVINVIVQTTWGENSARPVQHLNFEGILIAAIGKGIPKACAQMFSRVCGPCWGLCARFTDQEEGSV